MLANKEDWNKFVMTAKMVSDANIQVGCTYCILYLVKPHLHKYHYSSRPQKNSRILNFIGFLDSVTKRTQIVLEKSIS